MIMISTRDNEITDQPGLNQIQPATYTHRNCGAVILVLEIYLASTNNAKQIMKTEIYLM